jgi:hypothetical protein
VLRLVAAAVLLLSACVPQPPVSSPIPQALPSPSVQTAPGASPLVAVRLYDQGLSLGVPPVWGWSAGFEYINRATQRQFIASNGPLGGLPLLPGNGDIDASSLPSGRVVVEVESFCRLVCQGPTTETSFPIDWSGAAPLLDRPLPAGRNERAVGFRWFDQPLFFVARWADDAPAADIAAIGTIARSIRPEPSPPPTGEFNGWVGLGELGNIAVGTVTLTPLPTGAVVGQRTFDNVPFFLVRGKQGTYAFVSRPLFDDSCAIQYDTAADRFTCVSGGRTYRWTRFGTYLGPEPASHLAQHRVIVRDGRVWVHYTTDTMSFPTVPDEAAER